MLGNNDHLHLEPSKMHLNYAIYKNYIGDGFIENITEMNGADGSFKNINIQDLNFFEKRKEFFLSFNF